MKTLLSLAVACAFPLAAQLSVPSSHAGVKSALAALEKSNAWTLENQISICQIASPPFGEHKRAIEFKRRLEALGLTKVWIDSAGNVIAERKGMSTGPSVLVTGHLDTVFPAGTDVRVKRAGVRLSAPGIQDDCRGLAVVLATARQFQQQKIATLGTVYFVGDVGEEGPGNLRGVRNLFLHELKGKVDYFISVDEEGLDMTTRGVGSNRYRVTYKGPGGHSYGAFGRVNPVHALGRAVAQIAELRVPSLPKTTFSVSVISGGTSVNSIPFSATFEMDMRSESQEELSKLDARVQPILRAALDAENARWGAGTNGVEPLTLVIDTIGLRPANSGQSESSPIVATALAAARIIGFSPKLAASSTDANLPMSLGIPAVTIGGGGAAGNTHSLAEWYEDRDAPWRGPQWTLLLVAALAGVRQ